MQTRVKGWTFAGESSIESEIGLEAVCSMIEEIQPLVAPHGVGAVALANAFKEALLEIGKKNIENSTEEIRSCFIELILWKLFARGGALWIGVQTKARNPVPLDLLVAAYSVWKNAANLAARQGLDAAAAAEALAQATHATADRIAQNGRDSESEEIRDLRKYLFASYMYLITRVAAKPGSRHTGYVDMREWTADREFSDRGAFLNVLDSGILCRELLDAMPPKGRSVAIARYVLGYSWPETADSLGTSINAAQKTLSSGIRNAFGMCMQELRRMGCRKYADIESHLMKRKKTRVWR